MNNDIILWIQAASIEKQPILSKNGTLIANDDFSYSNLCEQAISVKSEYKNLLDFNGTHLYQICSNQYLLISNFRETDAVGRQISFSAKITADDEKDIISVLQKEASLYNYSLSEQICEKIDNALKKKKILKLTIPILIVILIGIVAFLIGLNRN